MKRTIPFTKTITFRTMIAEITDIEVKHTLELKDNYEIEGDILVDGTYKMTDASQIEEEFHYKLPFTISLDPKYDTKNMEIVVGDFYFEIINEEDLKINVEIDIDGLEEQEIKPEIISSKISLDEKEPVEELEIAKKEFVRDSSLEEAMPIPMEMNEEKEKLEFGVGMNPLDKLSYEIEEDIKDEEMINPNYTTNTNDTIKTKTSVSSIFSSISSSEETFSTYHVYIVRENDTIEYIIDKYKTSREELQNYNDLNDIKVGSKIIIPCPINE